MSISILQVLFILVPIVSLILVYRLVTGKSKSELDRPLQSLHWSFLGSVLGTVLFLLLSASAEQLLTTVSGIVAFLLVAWLALIAGIAFWISLGTLASRLKRSPTIWVGLSFITAPIGPIVSYFWMWSLTKDAIRLRRAAA